MSQSLEKFGNYILLEKIQTGGMAEIYLARKPGAGGVSRFVAIKRILPQFSEQIEFIDMFKDEAKIAVQLSHANIVSIFEFGVEKHQFFLAMDYVEGRNLRQIINKMKKSGVGFSVEQVLYTIKEVAGGLDHAHRCIDTNTGKPLNIIHRDMSPQNIMVSFEGEVKVVDFGIAKAETQLDTTRAGTLKGKFGYMSPEQAEGQNVDLRTDIFALGIVLWELLANDRLFVANNEINTLRKVRDCQIPSLRKINPNIPPELERIVSKALAKDRNLRYQTAAAFNRELSRFLNRQHPDFSPHDFSVFIKTLFATEILESRKKMVEYSKFEWRNDIPANELPPGKSSSRADNDLATEQSQFTHSNTFTENTGAPTEFGAKPPPIPERKTHASASLPPPPPNPLPARKKTPPLAKATAPPPRRQSSRAPSATSPAAIDTTNLMVDRSTYREREHQTQTREGMSQHGSTYFGTRSFSHSDVSRGWSLGSVVPVALIVIALSVGGISVYNPKSVAGYLPESWRPLVEHSTKKPDGKTEQSSAAPMYDVVIMSTPSGADILIDDKLANDTTPTTLRLPQNKDAKVTVRLPGHIAYEQMLKIDSAKSLNVVLQPAKMAKLDINVVGAGQIFVDGKLVAAGSPANNLAVRADVEITVRAEDPLTKAFDEVHVRVPENATKRITLIPRAFQKRGDP